MKIIFDIKEDLYEETKSFIRTLPTARFNDNPMKFGDTYNISLTLSVHDGNKLSQFFEKPSHELNENSKPNNGILNKILNFCKI